MKKILLVLLVAIIGVACSNTDNKAKIEKVEFSPEIEESLAISSDAQYYKVRLSNFKELGVKKISIGTIIKQGKNKKVEFKEGMEAGLDNNNADILVRIDTKNNQVTDKVVVRQHNNEEEFGAVSSNGSEPIEMKFTDGMLTNSFSFGVDDESGLLEKNKKTLIADVSSGIKEDVGIRSPSLNYIIDEKDYKDIDEFFGVYIILK